MKNVLLLMLVVVLTCTAAYSQKPKKQPNCKSVKEKTDDFTGAVTKSTSRVIFFGNAFIGFRKSGTEYFIDFYIKIQGEKNAALKEGEELQLKLTSGEVLTFKATKDVAPTTKVSSSSSSVSVYSTFFAEYSCSVDDLTKISNSIPTNLKVTIANEVYQLKLGKSEGSGLQKDAFCIIQ